jgi:hypothetical protein
MRLRLVLVSCAGHKAQTGDKHNEYIQFTLLPTQPTSRAAHFALAAWEPASIDRNMWHNRLI